MKETVLNADDLFLETFKCGSGFIVPSEDCMNESGWNKATSNPNLDKKCPAK